MTLKGRRTLPELKVLRFHDNLKALGCQAGAMGQHSRGPSSGNQAPTMYRCPDPLCMQAAFEQVVVRFPQATAKLMEGMTRRLAAASTVRQLPPTFDPFGHAASSATAAVRGTPLGTAAAPGGQGVQRGEIVTIALVPAGGLEPSTLPYGRRCKLEP